MRLPFLNLVSTAFVSRAFLPTVPTYTDSDLQNGQPSFLGDDTSFSKLREALLPPGLLNAESMNEE